jgi:hypothetical protein
MQNLLIRQQRVTRKFKRTVFRMKFLAAEQFKRHNIYYLHTRKFIILAARRQSCGILPRPIKQRPFREIPPVFDLNLQINPLPVHRHADVQTAKLVAKTFGRHLGISYSEFFNAVYFLYPIPAI